MNTKIDMVIPYVNNQDQVWRKTYVNYCQQHNLKNKIVELAGIRYGGLTYIYHQLQLITKNMPWINKIYLLLSNKEQIIESLLPPNCEIVLHKEFIPLRYLPTFNSTTIEMFLWNIPNLSEYFIYANDDMLPTGKLQQSDFFEEDKIKISWKYNDINSNFSEFNCQCFNNCNSLSKKLNLKLDKNTIIKPFHSFTPMIKSHCVECFELLKDLVLPKVRAFRTIYQHNQYIYPLYEKFKYGTLDSKIDFLYTELKEDFTLDHQIVCVNGEKNNIYKKKFLEEIEKIL